jgi:methyltransferase (TIGR00027 family)
MQEAKPSRTAMRVALRRAAHQLFDEPKVLDDPLALRIIGPEAVEELKAAVREKRGRLPRAIRAFMAVRSRYAEDRLAQAVARGTAQYVVLGAGLDTFAYRNPYADGALRVFEVDYPATQEWKRRKLAAASISVPASVTYSPVDFERQTLADGLRQVGFDREKPAFFSGLGVSMYLTDEAVTATLRFVGSMPCGSGIVFDYAVPRETLGLLGRMALDAISRRVASAGEPFRTFFEPKALAERLKELGFQACEDLGADEINARYFSNRTDGLRVGGSLGRLMAAET